MKKLYRLKVTIAFVFFLITFLCVFDYYIVHHRSLGQQKLWPIYNWALGFEKIRKVFRNGEVEVVSCNSIKYKKPLPIKYLMKKHKLKWKNTIHYKYLLYMSLKNPKLKAESRKSFENEILNQLPCDKITYFVYSIKKNIKTKKETKTLIDTLEYKKTSAN